MRFAIAHAVVLLLTLRGTLSLGQAEKPAIPADFRVSVALKEATTDQGISAEWLAYKGRVLEIIDGRHELILIDPIARRVELLDLNRKRIARISFDRLDAELAAHKARLQRTVDKLATSSERADKIKAAKTADLLNPAGSLTYDVKSHTLRRTGKTSEVVATGAPDGDSGRLEMIRLSLAYLVKLDTYRAPEKLPPFVQLHAINALIQDHHVRPTEISLLFRLNGPPIRFRWTHVMTPSLTAKDVELWTKLDNFLKTANVMDFDAYEQAVRDEKARRLTPAGR
jgi:hypothetical protein